MSVFERGERVDVIGDSKGKGFAGVVKRHGFRGGQRHTASRTGTVRRAPSARAPRPGVYQGTADGRPHGRRAGHREEPQSGPVDPERNLLVVEGASPAARKGLLMIRGRGRQEE